MFHHTVRTGFQGVPPPTPFSPQGMDLQTMTYGHAQIFYLPARSTAFQHAVLIKV